MNPSRLRLQTKSCVLLSALLLSFVSPFFVAGCSGADSKSPLKAESQDGTPPSGTVPPANPVTLPTTIAIEPDLTFFSTPEEEHQSWTNLIATAQQSIVMEMYHLTDLEVIAKLRERPPSVKIDLILDGDNLKEANTAKLAAELVANRANITIYPSSSGFNETHSKAIIVDGNVALITSMNLTNNAKVQRDYGVQTSSAVLIEEMSEVFSADIMYSKNAAAQVQPQKGTPVGVGQGDLIWSPLNSEDRLVSLILESTKIPAGPNKYIHVTVENFGDDAIQTALSQAAAAHVQVRLIVPQCVLGTSFQRNYQYFKFLTGVQYRVMPHPSSAQKPYMHGKMMVLGNKRFYLGSVNYSKNSTHFNRELGIVTRHAKVSAQLETLFERDWEQAVDVPDITKLPTCPAGSGDPTI